MAEYIEREAVCYQLEKQETIDGQPRAIRRARRIVADFPTADVRPVRRGKWTRRKSKLYTMCSACGYGYSNSHYHEVEEFKFCPNCGAMMEASDGKD